MKAIQQNYQYFLSQSWRLTSFTVRMRLESQNPPCGKVENIANTISSVVYTSLIFHHVVKYTIIYLLRAVSGNTYACIHVYIRAFLYVRIWWSEKTILPTTNSNRATKRQSTLSPILDLKMGYHSRHTKMYRNRYQMRILDWLQQTFNSAAMVRILE